MASPRVSGQGFEGKSIRLGGALQARGEILGRPRAWASLTSPSLGLPTEGVSRVLDDIIQTTCPAPGRHGVRVHMLQSLSPSSSSPSSWRTVH